MGVNRSVIISTWQFASMLKLQHIYGRRWTPELMASLLLQPYFLVCMLFGLILRFKQSQSIAVRILNPLSSNHSYSVWVIKVLTNMIEFVIFVKPKHFKTLFFHLPSFGSWVLVSIWFEIWSANFIIPLMQKLCNTQIGLC